jgi:glycosyltransferase involved in cell wall biosynthesis
VTGDGDGNGDVPGGVDTGRSPRVSVLLPTYDERDRLPDAVDAVLDQTFESFELLVLDGGSTDGTRSFVRSVDDDRVRLVELDGLGLAASLDAGLDEARGEYVARVDADTVPVPDRLAEQVAVLDDDPDCVVLGGAMRYVPRDVDDEDGTDGDDSERGQVLTQPPDDVGIRRQLVAHNAFLHPTVMFRTRVARACGGYREYPFEDYELWTRLLRHGTGRNLQRVLAREYLRPDSVMGETDNWTRLACNLRCGLLMLRRHRFEPRAYPKLLARRSIATAEDVYDLLVGTDHWA